MIMKLSKTKNLTTFLSRCEKNYSDNVYEYETIKTKVSMHISEKI